MDWIQLTTESALNTIKVDSEKNNIVIFKHSTRCPISAMALSRLERAWKKEEMSETPFYFLDLISYRELSNKIANAFDIPHESPQLLIINHGTCVYDASHQGINYAEVKGQLEKMKN